MALIRLQPARKDAKNLLVYVNTNFARIREAFHNLGERRFSTVEVTGSIEIATGMSIVDNVSVTMNDAPVAGAAFVSARPSATAGSIIIEVYKDDYTLSIIPVEISWYAAGSV